MKRILIIAFVLWSTLGYSQQSIKDFTVRNKLTVGNEFELDDSSVVTITTGDTLVTKEWTEANTLSMTGNDTEIFFNSGGILASSPLFTYSPLDSTLTVDSLLLANGEKISWNTDRYTLNIPSGLGWTNQAGQELNILVYNNSGSLIPNGTAVYPNGTFNDVATLGLGQSDTHETIGVDYGLTTTSLGDGNYGGVVWFGEANDLNTSLYNLGDTLWISSTEEGKLVNVKPLFPNYAIQIGVVFKVGTTDGIIFVTSRSHIDDTFINYYNGTIRELFDFRVTATGGVITGTLSPTNGHPDLTLIFSDGFTTFDTSPSATVTLTAGTNGNPQMNYIYIPKATKQLTVSTSGWPTEESKRIARVYLKSASFVEKYKATINQNVNDPLANTTTLQGQFSVVTNRLRLEHAKHINGTEANSTIDDTPTPDDVWVTVTSGEVAQLNTHTYPSFDSETGDSLYVENHFTNPDTLIGNINELINDALGNSMENSSIPFILWGVINKTGEPSLLKINLPIGVYAFASPENAVLDALGYAVKTIPKVYTGVGFLIAKLTYTYKNNDWVLYDITDLRGDVPNVGGGGGAGGGTGVTTFLGLTDTESSYTAYEFQVANAGATALESPTGLKYYGDSLVVDNNSIVHGNIGIGITTPLSALHLNKGTGLLNGINFSSTLSNGLYLYGTDELSIKSGDKRLISFKENVTEQVIINPDGDVTGTLDNPSLAISYPNMGFYAINPNVLQVTVNGVNTALFSTTGLQSRDNLPVASNNYDLGTSTRIWEELWVNNINNPLDISFNINSIEAMRLTEDTVFVKNYAKFDSTAIFMDNVGIGTDSLLSKLHLEGNNSVKASIITLKNTNDTDGAKTGIEFITSTINDPRSAIYSQRVGGYFPSLTFHAGASNDERMRIDYDGNVGIGDATPSYKLDVNGTGRFTGIVNFDVFPITPSSAPTTDYQVANKKYVDDASGLLTGITTSTNTALGLQSLNALTTGFYNTVTGYQSGLSITDGVNNTIIGQQAGATLTTGDNNTIIGAFAGNGTTGDGNIFIGNTAGENETGSNKLNVDNTNTATPLIYGEFDNDIVKINGTQVQSTGIITDNDATPDVSAANVWTYNGTANAVTVTDLDNPDVGAIYRIIGNSDTYTITINDAVNFNLSANFVGGIDDVLTIFVQADNDYIEISRSNN